MLWETKQIQAILTPALLATKPNSISGNEYEHLSCTIKFLNRLKQKSAEENKKITIVIQMVLLRAAASRRDRNAIWGNQVSVWRYPIGHYGGR